MAAVAYQPHHLLRRHVMPKEIAGSVEDIENEAEKLLEEASAQAREILSEAREEARKTLSSELSLDEVKGEYDRIVNEAREEAERKRTDSEKRAAAISDNAEKKAREITGRMVSIIAGRS